MKSAFGGLTSASIGCGPAALGADGEAADVVAAGAATPAWGGVDGEEGEGVESEGNCQRDTDHGVVDRPFDGRPLPPSDGDDEAEGGDAVSAPASVVCLEHGQEARAVRRRGNLDGDDVQDDDDRRSDAGSIW